MDMADVTAMLAGVKRMVWGIANRFDMDGSQYWKVSTDLAQVWMNENYETVAGAVLTAANALDMIYFALDDNLV